MNRAERRMFKKKLGKDLAPIADDQKLERLIADEIKTLNYQQLMLVTAYIESSMPNK